MSAKESAMPVAELLRGRRKELGLSQQTLASQAECSIAMVRLLESGYLPQGGEVVTRIMRVLAA